MWVFWGRSVVRRSQRRGERQTFLWRETSLRSGTLHPFPSCAGVERRLRACALRRRDGVCGRGPRCGPLAILWRRARLASGWLCRRLSGGRMLVAVVLHLLCADRSAGSVGHAECRSRWRKRGRCGMPPRGRRAGAGRFGVRPRPGGRMQTGARCRRDRDSFLSGNRVTENKTSTLPASAAHHP